MRRHRHVLAALTASLAVIGLVGPAASAAPPSRPAVAGAHVESQTSTSVRIGWRNPAAGDFSGTVVRYATGDAAPTKPSAGRLAGRVPDGRHALTVARLQPGRHYAFALFARYPNGRFAHRVTIRATTGPAPVTGLAAFDDGSHVSLRWTNPTTHSFRGVVVRYAVGGRPPARGHGSAVHLASPTATSAQLPQLARNTRYSVSVWARDAAQHYSSVAASTFATPRTAGKLGSITGTVTDRSGHPLAGVAVGAQSGDTGGPAGATTTAGDGSYSLSLPAGNYEIDFYGANATGGNSDATGYVGDFDFTSVAAGHAVSVAAHLSAGAAVSGRVQDVAGHGLAGVQPYAEPPNPYVQADTDFIFIVVFGGVQTQPTAADGTFLAKGLPTGAVQLCFDTTSSAVTGGDSGSYAGRCVQRTLLLAARRTASVSDVVLQASDTGELTGTVTGSNGLPQAYALVEVQRHDGFDGGYAFTGADGSYHIGGLSAGRYDVCADPVQAPADGADPGDTTSCLPGTVQVRAQQSTSAPRVQLPQGGAVAGEITGPDGRPLAGAFIDVEGPGLANGGTAETDSRGQFVVHGLPNGRYRVCADGGLGNFAYPTGLAQSCYRHKQLVAVTTGTIRLGINVQLKVGAAMAGRVTDDRGHPLRFVEVDVESVSNWMLGGGAETDGSGRYRAIGLVPGRYTVCFFGLDGALLGSEACHAGMVTVRAGATTRHVDGVLRTGGAIRVTVNDTSGDRLAGVDATAVGHCNRNSYCHKVRLLGKSGTIAASDSTGQDGTVLLTGLRPGDYSVCLYAYQATAAVDDSPTGYVDSCDSTFDVTVTNHRTTVVTRALAKAGTVSGTVTDADGNPLAGVRVTVARSGASDYVDDEDFGFFPPSLSEPAADTITGADGTYTIHGVQPGTRTVCVDASAATGGSSTTGYLSQCLGAAPGSTSGGTAVAVHAGQTTSAGNLALTSASAITGRITDVLGHPLYYSAAGVYDAQGTLLQVADPDRAGRYTLSGLPAGTYTVCFQALKMAAQCYRGVAWNANAPRLPSGITPVATSAGATVTGIDAAMRP